MQDGKVKYLADVLHVPHITKNLVSVGQMVEQGLHVQFNPEGCFVKEFIYKCKLVARSKISRRMFTLDVSMSEVKTELFAHYLGVVVDTDIWHKGIGHVNMQRLKLMQSKGIVTGLPKFKVDGMEKNCEACQFGKQAKHAFPHDKNVSKNMLDIVHSDVWGPANTMSMGGCI